MVNNGFFVLMPNLRETDKSKDEIISFGSHHPFRLCSPHQNFVYLGKTCT